MRESKKSDLYIFYRKCKAFAFRLRFYLCRVFPVRRNRITVCAFEGKRGFCCNPKYLVEELHRRNKNYEFVWFVNDPGTEMPDYVHKAANTPWRRAFYMSTASIWIDNYRNPYGVCKRRGQFYLNVNHYTTGIKTTGLWRGEKFSEMAYLVSKSDSDMMDALVTDSTWCDAVMPKGMLFDGAYLRTGAPRCDVLYGDRTAYRELFKKRHGLPADAKVCMFAPTFREGAVDGKRFVFSAEWTIDFARLLDDLTERFGGSWYLCVRVHPQLAAGVEEYRDKALGERIIDESRAEDMYEILAGMDAYITDYSSAVFEAGYAGIPAFLYVEDLEAYTRDRGSLWWTFPDTFPGYAVNNKDMTPQFDLTMPYAAATDQEDLTEAIMSFDDNVYRESLRAFNEAVKLVFDGRAASRLADVVEEKIV